MRARAREARPAPQCEKVVIRRVHHHDRNHAASGRQFFSGEPARLSAPMMKTKWTWESASASFSTVAGEAGVKAASMPVTTIADGTRPCGFGDALRERGSARFSFSDARVTSHQMRRGRGASAPQARGAVRIVRRVEGAAEEADAHGRERNRERNALAMAVRVADGTLANGASFPASGFFVSAFEISSGRICPLPWIYT